MVHKIKQPKNISDGSLSLKWSQSFGRDRSAMFDRIQGVVDNEVLRHMVPYTPMQTGTLMRSATLGTVIGSGRIVYTHPGARYLYYGELMVSSVTGSAYAASGEQKVLTGKELSYNAAVHPLAGKLWFERMKADKLDAIKRAAAKAGGIK